MLKYYEDVKLANEVYPWHGTSPNTFGMLLPNADKLS